MKLQLGSTVRHPLTRERGTVQYFNGTKAACLTWKSREWFMLRKDQRGPHPFRAGRDT